jgi:Tol biopolymer transport system component
MIGSVRPLVITVAVCASVWLIQAANRTASAQRGAANTAAAQATLARATFEATAQRLTVYDLHGHAIQALGEPAIYRWPALSPDGRRLAFVKEDPSTRRQDLYVLERSSGAVVQLTSDAAVESSPTWSADGRSLAYVSNRDGASAIYRRTLTANDAELLYRPSGNPILSDWSSDGRNLLFSVVDAPPANSLIDPLGLRTSLFLLTIGREASQAVATPITVVDDADVRVLGAKFSPDGGALAYRSNQSGSNQIWVVRLDANRHPTGQARQVSVHGALGMATWRHDGRELYFLSADRELMAVAVGTSATGRVETPRRLFVLGNTSYAFQVSDFPFVGAPDGLGSIGADGREAVFISVAPKRGAPFPLSLTVFDRHGRVVRTLGAPAGYSQPTLSPDGTRVAAYRDRGLWVFDIASGKRIQITPGGLAYSVAWSPDGRDVAYASYRNSRTALYRTPADGSGPEQVMYRHQEPGAFIPLTDWSPDGQFLSVNGGNVLWTLSAHNNSAFQMPPSEFNVFGARVSPDGRFVAYVSDESGTKQVYVRPFDPSSGFSRAVSPWRISSDGGVGMVQWRRDGRELYYVSSEGGVMAVDVNTTPSFHAGSPTLLFRLPETFPLNRTNYPDCSCAGAGGCEQGSISRDGNTFVFAVPTPPERKEVALSPPLLARYAGTYSLGTTDVVLSVEGNDLMFRTRDTKARLFAESERRLFLKATNGDLEFFADDSGRMSSFLFYTGGAPRLALRKE